MPKTGIFRGKVSACTLFFILLFFASGCSTEIGVRKTPPSERRYYGVADFSDGSLNASTINLLSNFQLQELYWNDPENLISRLEALYRKNRERAMIIALADTALQIGYRFKSDPDLSSRYFLSAAFYSSFYLKAVDNADELYDERRIRMIRICNLASTELFCYLKECALERKQGFELTMPGSGRKIFFKAPAFELPLPESSVEDFSVCADYRTENLTHDTRVFGLGVPLVSVLREDCRDKVTSIALPGMPIAVTLVFDFTYDRESSNGTGRLRYIYSRTADKVKLGKRLLPLASDFSTPLAKTSDMPVQIHFLRRTLKVKEAAAFTGLYLFEPYDDTRIPVVFVHGLMSDMRTWGQMLNTLLHDPVIRKKYQFLGFAYSSGNPVFYSGWLLRKELASLRTKLQQQNRSLENFNKMVLVGHSMGGLLSRLQITNCTPELAANVFGIKDPEKLKGKFRKEEAAHSKKMISFRAGDFIKRVIFIAVPHKGSEIARSWVGSIGSFFIELPLDLVRVNVSILETLIKTGKINLEGMGSNTGIDNLRPDSPMLHLLNQLPIAPHIPFHSIIGNNKKASTPGGTDGVVPYWSSHLDQAESELIVKSGHSAHRVPLAIQEVRHILLEHLKKI